MGFSLTTVTIGPAEPARFLTHVVLAIVFSIRTEGASACTYCVSPLLLIPSLAGVLAASAAWHRTRRLATPHPVPRPVE